MRENNRINGNGKHMSNPTETPSKSETLFDRLAAPFPADVIGWKAQAVSGERALVVAYIDARTVMDRLDEVVGPENWRDNYRVQDNGTVICGLTIRFNDEWLTKFDVGSRSDQEDEGDREKAAFSDGLKRAAVKWGIGRYLYSLPKQWVGYDPRKKQFTEQPRLPSWAIPSGSSSSTPAAAPTVQASGATIGDRNGNGHRRTSHDPRTGRELFRWLRDQEQALVADQLAQPGELIGFVATAGAQAGYGERIVNWNESAVVAGLAEAHRFIAGSKGEPVLSK
jgi:hypothetical protein